MSATIDERIVSMQFDNKRFEQNAQDSLNTLEKLQKSLQFKDAHKGFENINYAAKKLDFGALSSGVETVKAKFSALEVMAVTALANITNSAVNAGKRILKALTIDPVKMGFNEYELKMNSVQTIMSSTGESLETVNGYLNELNEYSDKTIYSFSDMTQNIGKFTNAGVKLEDAVLAIKGISNEAALSGANANEASRAMYNFAQALSAGHVKLIDWKSIENANMATVKFKEQLMDSAVAAGTLRKEADGMYTVLTKDANGASMKGTISATKNFNDSLSHQWMTTEVLVNTLKNYADETTAIGKEAFAAAQDVKTFSMMIDTLKESVQSGWAQTSEILFGDLDEAKSMWTSVTNVLSDVFTSSLKARNEMLQSWKDLGGRIALIKSIKNIWEGLVSVVTPIKEAFREIFPPMTAARLFELTERFRDLTAKFKLSSEQSEKLKTVFKGLFSGIDIGIRLFKALASGAIKLLGNFTGLGDNILDIASAIGKWIIGIRDSVKETNIFTTSISKLVSFLQNVIEKIKEFASVVGEKIKFPGLEGVLSIFTGIWNVIKKIGSIVGSVFGKIGEGLASAFNAGDLNKGMSLLNGGLFAGLLVGLNKFVNGGKIQEAVESITKPFQKIKEILKPVTSILDEVKGCLTAWQQSIKAGALLKIASALAILAISLVMIAAINPERLSGAIIAITTLFADLVGSLKLLTTFSKIDRSLSRSIGVMVGLSLAVLILASAIKKIGKLSPDELQNGLSGIMGLMGSMVASMIALGKYQDKAVKGALGMVVFAVAIRVLASSVKTLSNLSWEEMAKGLSGTVILMFMMSGVAKMLSGNKGLVRAGTGLLIFAAAMKVMASVCKTMSTMSWEEIGKGLSGTIVLMYALSGAAKLLSGNKRLVSAGVGMVLFAAALKILVPVLKEMGAMSLESIGKGLLTLGVSVGIMAAGLNFMKGTLGGAVAMLVAANAIKVLAPALASLGSMSGEEIGKSLLTLGIALAEFAIALNFMKGTLGGAAALLVASAALAIFAPVLKTLGSMSWGEMLKGLITLAGIFAILGIAGAVLTPVVPAILGLAGALTLISLSVVGLGVGLMLVATAIGVFATITATSALSIVASLTIIVTGIANLIPLIIMKIGEGIVAFCEVIGTSGPAICTAITAVMMSILDSIIQLAPKLAETIGVVLDSLIPLLMEYTPKLIELALTLLLSLLQGIRDNIGVITQTAVEIITAFLVALGENLPKIVDAGFKMIISFINGISKAIVDNAELLRNAILGLCKAIIDAVLSFFGIHSPSTVFAEIGKNLILGLIKGLGSLVSSVISKITDIGKSMINTLGNFASNVKSKGVELIKNLKNGISSKVNDIKSAAKDIASKFTSTLKDKVSSLKQAGKDLMGGLKEGVESMKNKVLDCVKGIGKGIASKFKSILGIKSPSRVFAEFGKFIDQGLIKGIEGYSNKVLNVTGTLGNGVITEMMDSISGMSGKSITPTVRPVMDLSNFDTFSMADYKLGSNIDTSFTRPIVSLSSIMTKSQADITASNERVVSAIDSLRNDMDLYYSAEDNKEIALYVDSKKLATTIAKPMNQQLNILSKRGAY